MSTSSPAAPNPHLTAPRTGPISTAEIKARIEAMFPGDRHRPRSTPN
ncbi:MULTISPECIES: hypothetical protein [Rhodococcus]|nr:MULTISPECIES: hypothetical protein [Rhodococcus]KAF0961842.1 hypothetical protein MLGJGCBP_05068 [Rhodococcus sp. T7]QQZ18249.1 hypothetical protein GO592_39080 [Rhodococcus sp. 21391]UOT08181.1 hypothetical protein MPY17_38185 [Rhodococcus opacus]